MIFYPFSTRRLPQILFMGQAHLNHEYPHATRRVSETVLYVLTEGSMVLESGGERVFLRQGDVCFFDRGEFQRPLDTGESRYCYLHFLDRFETVEMDDRQARDFFRSSRRFFLQRTHPSGEPEQSAFSSLLLPKRFHINNKETLRQIRACFKKGGLDSRSVKSEQFPFYARLQAAEVLYFLQCAYSEALAGPLHTFRESGVRRLADFLEENLDRPLNGRLLEEAFGYSFDYMNRRFKESTGESIFAYLIRRRILRAQILLYTRQISVTEVARMTGFGSIYHFSKTFRRLTGMSPTESLQAMQHNF